MSLRWDVTKIENYGEKFPDRIEGERRLWNGATETIVFMMMFIDMQKITATNLPEVYRRIRLYEALFGNIAVSEGEAIPLPMQVIQGHIGLSVNVTEITPAQFNKKVLGEFKRENAVKFKHELELEKEKV